MPRGQRTRKLRKTQSGGYRNNYLNRYRAQLIANQKQEEKERLLKVKRQENESRKEKQRQITRKRISSIKNRLKSGNTNLRVTPENAKLIFNKEKQEAGTKYQKMLRRRVNQNTGEAYYSLVSELELLRNVKKQQEEAMELKELMSGQSNTLVKDAIEEIYRLAGIDPRTKKADRDAGRGEVYQGHDHTTLPLDPDWSHDIFFLQDAQGPYMLVLDSQAMADAVDPYYILIDEKVPRGKWPAMMYQYYPNEYGLREVEDERESI